MHLNLVFLMFYRKRYNITYIIFVPDAQFTQTILANGILYMACSYFILFIHPSIDPQFIQP